MQVRSKVSKVTETTSESVGHAPPLKIPSASSESDPNFQQASAATSSSIVTTTTTTTTVSEFVWKLTDLWDTGDLNLLKRFYHELLLPNYKKEG